MTVDGPHVLKVDAGRSAAFDQAAAAWRDACDAFAHMTGPYSQVLEAEAEMRSIGRDTVTGLVTVPVAAVHFSDVRADGARMAAVNGNRSTGEWWVCWSGRMLRFGVEALTYDSTDLVQLRGCR